MASQTTGISEAAGRYANALYQLADEQKMLDRVASDLKELRAMIGGSDDLKRLIRSPMVARQDQARVMAALAEKAGLSDLTRRFVGVVAANRRLFAMLVIIDAYLKLLAARRGEVTAEVASAKALTDRQVQALSGALRKAAGAKVSIDFKVDPGLIGGLVVKLGSRMVDSSLRAKLQRLELAMKGIG